MSKQFEDIKQIRRDKYLLDDSEYSKVIIPMYQTLKNILGSLAEDLNSKETHFIFELIQNVEDNYYDNCKPSLSIHLLRHDPTNTPNSDGALLIVNNEIGFNYSNIDAICDAKHSTKKDITGYIGEKGIGFKSVFKVTTTPHIISGGYQIRLPKELKYSDLGYIVPEWVEDIPIGIDTTKTNIILPLDVENYGFNSMAKYLRDFSPVTFLFLSKLTELNFASDDGFKRSILKEGTANGITTIKVNGYNGDEMIDYSSRYLMFYDDYKRPADLHEPERKNVKTSRMYIALPLDADNEEGKLFAYLPLNTETGLPFIINADFIITSSRDTLHEDRPWNCWLRDNLNDLYLSAFSHWVQSTDQLLNLFYYVPLETNSDFFKPVIQPIIEGLKSKKIVPTEPFQEGQDVFLEIHYKVFRPLSKFRELLNRDGYPQELLQNRILHEALDKDKLSEVWSKLGVETISSDSIIQCFKDNHWLEKQSLEWFEEAHIFLSSLEIDTEILRECSIIPIADGSKFTLSNCKKQQIFFAGASQFDDLLTKTPSFISVSVGFMSEELYSRIMENDKLMKWYKEVMEVKELTLDSYIKEIVGFLHHNDLQWSDEEILEATEFLIDSGCGKSLLSDMPLLINDGTRKSKNEKKEIVTPMGLDIESGWQNIFVSDDDRQHLLILSDKYLSIEESKIGKCFEMLSATESPLLRTDNLKDLYRDTEFYDYDLIVSEDKFSTNELKELKRIAYRSTGNKRHMMELERIISPSIIYKSISECLSISILKWLKGISKRGKDNDYSLKNKLLSKITYKYRNEGPEPIDSELLIFLKTRPWLTTNTGFCIPRETFQMKDGIYEELKDAVPYAPKDLPDSIIRLLEINTEVTLTHLYALLKHHSEHNTGTLALVQSLYFALNRRLLNADSNQLNAVKEFAKQRVILNPSETENRWVYRKNSIWSDRSDLFGDEFIYLSSIYSQKLKDFFIQRLGVEEDASEEHYATLWLNIQESEIVSIQKTEEILTTVYNVLKPILEKTPFPLPDWLKGLQFKSKIWTLKSTFSPKNKVFIPDCGTLVEAFHSHDIEFMWYPEGSYNPWNAFHRTFNIRSLRTTVQTKRQSIEYSEKVQSNTYFTSSAKKLIAVKLKEEQRPIYDLLYGDGRLKKLMTIIELKTQVIKVSYTLDSISEILERDCYWDTVENSIFYTEECSKYLIAKHVAEELNTSKMNDLLNLLQSCLSSTEKELYALLKEENWSIPEEIKLILNEIELIEDISKSEPESQVVDEQSPKLSATENEQIHNTEPHYSMQQQLQRNKQVQSIHSDGFNPKPTMESIQNSFSGASSKVQRNKSSDENDTIEQSTDYSLLISKRFSSNDKPIVDLIEVPDEVVNPARRRAKELQNHQTRIANEPDHESRRRIVEKAILEGPDESIRMSLLDWYRGKCQICGCDNGFIQRNGYPYYISTYIVERKFASHADNKGNALCLCAEHFAKLNLARENNQNDLINQLHELSTENGNQDVHFILYGKPERIRFVKDHIIALQTYLNKLGV